jgi:AraC family ethanolamine operon transcriptional activator
MDERIFYRHQSSKDFEEYCANARGWDLDYRQLESGRFSSERLSFGNASFVYAHTKIGRRLLQRGTTPPGLVTFGVLANTEISINWRNADINGGSLFIFPPDGELYSISPANFDAYPISLSEQKLNQVCSLLELPNFRRLINNKEIFLCNPQKMLEFRGYLAQVESRLLMNENTSRNLEFLLEIEDEIANRLLKMLAEHSQPARRKWVRKRDVAVRKAEAYILENSANVLTVPELCRVSNASQRMLEYAFRERYAMTPKAFILMFRLNNARVQLKKANQYNDQVTQIAQRNGFTHMGQFSAYYKKLFLECPSDTLRE